MTRLPLHTSQLVWLTTLGFALSPYSSVVIRSIVHIKYPLITFLGMVNFWVRRHCPDTVYSLHEVLPFHDIEETSTYDTDE